MKVLQIIPYFVPAWNYGGSVSSVYHVSKELVKRGHNATVYTTDTLDSHNRIKEVEETIDGIVVKRFRNWSNTVAGNHRIFWSPSMFADIRFNLKKFDIVHMNDYRSFQNVFSFYYARKYGVPYVLQAHGSLPVIMNKRWLKRLYDIYWGHKLLKGAAKLIALNNFEVAQYEKVGISRNMVEILSNGIDLDEFDNLPKKGGFRRKHGLNNQKIILYLGRLHQIKGLDLLVRAICRSKWS